jgi:hypothetical protein
MNFLLVASDRKNYKDEIVPANTIVNFRIKLGKWPIYIGTKNSETIAKNHKCIVYIAGKFENRQSFVCDFVVKDLLFNSTKENLEQKEFNIVTPVPLLNLVFEPTKIKKTIHINEVIESLEFTKNYSERSRGLPFIGGSRNLIDKDFNLLFEKINSKS